ncbi:hypothetical protein HK405_013586 [Cladochytrium tenue]|nr:hypothetical protein HK405_013586 [Cladochytrium tenue]
MCGETGKLEPGSDSGGTDVIDNIHATDNPDEFDQTDGIVWLNEIFTVDREEDDILESETQCAPAVQWTWSMPLKARWISIVAVLEVSRKINSKLVSKARVYEVEEASEVMEPILMSCIVSSTHKLEIIGDHLQLQPSLSQKFEFEQIYKVNMSLFERLVCVLVTHAQSGVSVAYLVTCGVPKGSIAVLTPYKGQLLHVRDMLIKKNMISSWPDGRFYDSCILSTVDRFHGDEADIVILSLVIDANATTPFVKIQNRMIVALSRARATTVASVRRFRSAALCIATRRARLLGTRT